MTDTTAFVYTMTRAGRAGAWSRYVFPFAIESFAQLGNVLYIRHGDVISEVDEDAVTDEVSGVPVNFVGRFQTSWQDFGQPGVTKMLEGFDYIGTGQGPSFSLGYDQRNDAAFTTPYAVDPDTLPGGIIPLPVAAPTLSVRLDFAGGEAWSVKAVNLYFHDLGNNP